MWSKDEFHQLKVSDIKALLVNPETVDYVKWACEDPRKGVQQIGQTYIKREQKILAEQQRMMHMYDYEGMFYSEGLYHVAGIDEVGRGPIAGPVTVAAVILPPHAMIAGLNDSKKLSETKREALYDEIMNTAVTVSVVSYTNEQIDALNIYEATRQAMYEAIRQLSTPAQAVLVDAMPLPDLTMPVESLIKGDSKSASIAAASIVAKVTRDRYMASLDASYPEFQFSVHKGYYTPVHKKAIRQYGLTPLHRHTFEPVKSIVNGVILHTEI